MPVINVFISFIIAQMFYFFGLSNETSKAAILLLGVRHVVPVSVDGVNSDILFLFPFYKCWGPKTISLFSKQIRPHLSADQVNLIILEEEGGWFHAF